jgi:hypothetical protein
MIGFADKVIAYTNGLDQNRFIQNQQRPRSMRRRFLRSACCARRPSSITS